MVDWPAIKEQKIITKNDKVTATKNDLEVIYKYIKENHPQANITSRITSYFTFIIMHYHRQNKIHWKQDMIII
jgi:hypothetical protein